MSAALALALSLMLTDAPPADASGGEPLPPGAPTDSYQLAAWCYGALDEYLGIYQTVMPDLRDIDHMFGSQVVEDQPYQSDMAAARVELKLIGESVTDAEKASAQPISDRGVAAIKEGRAIWSLAEAKTRRELARAWLGWALPDRCDTNAKELTQRSLLLGRALGYNAPSAPAAGDAPSAHDDAPQSPAVPDAGAPSTPATPAASDAPAGGDAINSLENSDHPAAATPGPTPAPAPTDSDSSKPQS